VSPTSRYCSTPGPCPADQQGKDDAELDDQIGEAISNGTAAVKLASVREQGPRQRHGGIRARGRGGAQAGRKRERPGPDISEQPDDDPRPTVCTTADRAKPRISSQGISQVIDPLRASA
jgi:hypothetical protein